MPFFLLLILFRILPFLRRHPVSGSAGVMVLICFSGQDQLNAHSWLQGWGKLTIYCMFSKSLLLIFLL